MSHPRSLSFARALVLGMVGLASPAAFTACIDATENATACSKNLSALSGLCPVGTTPKFASAAHGTCAANGEYKPDESSGEVAGTCASDGTCEVACVAMGNTCPCGIASISKEKIECRTDCAPGCGDGVCDENEDTKSCPADCAAPASSTDDAGPGEASGSAGASGSGGAKGGGGAPGSGGRPNGSAGGAPGDTDGGQPSTADCGELRTFGHYVLRGDGILLQVSTAGAGSQTPVLDGTTRKPLTHVVDAADQALFGCAALDDGKVECWRTARNGNVNGGLGNGATDSDGALFEATTVLTAPGKPLTDVVALSENSSDGAGATCAITSEGKLYCWGALDWIVNAGTKLASAYAQAITLDGIEELTGVTQAAVAFGGACAVRDVEGAKAVWCWGAGRYDQLPNKKDSQYPLEILGLTNPTKVAVDATTVYNYVPIHTFCALDDGSVRCWGSNGHGEVGNDTIGGTVPAPSLVKIASGSELSGITDLVGGGSAGITQGNGSFCAFRNGAVWCWGGGYAKHAASYGATNVVQIGDAWGPTFLTSDDLLHVGSNTATPDCGKL